MGKLLSRKKTLAVDHTFITPNVKPYEMKSLFKPIPGEYRLSDREVWLLR